MVADVTDSSPGTQIKMNLNYIDLKKWEMIF